MLIRPVCLQVPFELRVEIFRAFIACVFPSCFDRRAGFEADSLFASLCCSNDRRRLGIDRYARNGPRYHTTIRRGKVAEDRFVLPYLPPLPSL